MTTITTKTVDRREPYLYVSDPADPSIDTVELEIDSNLPHVFIGVQLFDSGGVRIPAATAGSFAVDVKTIQTELFEAPPTPTIDATAPLTISVAGNVRQVRVVPTGVLGNDVTTWRVVATCNRS